MVKIALVLAVAIAIGAVAAAAVLAGRGAGGALVQLARATSTALAWGAGILIAVPASLQALREDGKSGVRALLIARGASRGVYARARVGGLAIVLAAVVGGGTLVAGGAAVLLASRAGVARGALEGLVASLVYAAAFALVLAPMSLAAFGARPPARGYARFLAILVLPLIFEPWLSGFVPPGWGELLSIPSALDALRASLPPDGFDGARFARAALVLAAFAVLCFALVLGEIAALDARGGGNGTDGDDEVRA